MIYQTICSPYNNTVLILYSSCYCFCVLLFLCLPCVTMTLCFLQVIEVEGQLTELFQINRNLQVQNDEIPILRDSIEEMRYLESKVVCVCVWGCGWVCVGAWVCGLLDLVD